MAMPPSGHAYRRLVTAIVHLANLALIVQILLARAGRLAESDEAFLTLRFGMVLGGAALMVALSTWLVTRARTHELIQQAAGGRGALLLALGFPAMSLAVLAALQSLITAVQPYLLAFALWLLLLTLALWAALLWPRLAPQRASAGGLRETLGSITLALLLGVLVPLLLVELGLRFWIRTFGSEPERVAYVYSAEEISARTVRFRGVPYVNFGLSTNYPEHNSRGYRGPEIAVPKPEGAFRIVALGGSTTYGELLDDWRDAYPARLEQMLHDEYGYEQVEVINAGVPYYTTWDTLVNFEFRVLDLQPDLVIVYHAVNDLSARALPPEGYHGIPASAGIWQSQPDPGPSTLYRYLAVNLGWMRNPNDLRTMVQAYEQAGRECCDHLTHDETAARFRANPPIYFERNLRSLIAVAQAHDVQVLLSSWAYFPDETEGDWNLQALPYRQEALEEHNAVAARLAADTGAAFYDLMGSFPHNRDYWFVDGMHLTPAGTIEQARQYAAFLVEQGLIPEPA